MSENEKQSSAEPIDLFPALTFTRRYLPHIGLAVGLFLSIPDWVREVGSFGGVLALCSAIVLAGRTVAAAIEKRGV